MRINSLRISNYRTLESVDLNFLSPYTAICGPNDCGKTNVVRAIRALFNEEPQYAFFEREGEEDVSIKENFPKWKDTKATEREIAFDLELSKGGIRRLASWHSF